MSPDYQAEQCGISLTMKKIIKSNNLEEDRHDTDNSDNTTEQTTHLFGSESENSVSDSNTFTATSSSNTNENIDYETYSAYFESSTVNEEKIQLEKSSALEDYAEFLNSKIMTNKLK
jgi:hypothetical protein